MLRNLFHELKRRRVFRVAGVYAVAAWATIEVTSTVLPLLGAPQWAPRVVVVLALLGFPVTMLLAWAFDITAEGVVRTPANESGTLPPAPVIRLPVGRAAGLVGLGMLIALIGFGAYAHYHVPALTNHGEIQSIAVLPFLDLSAQQNQGYFADGITEELLNRLAQVPGLEVAARTSSFAFKGKNEDVAEIARQLRVQAVLEGSVRRADDQVRITAQLIDARNGYHLWSNNYDREVANVFDLQDEIAGAIVAALKLQLNPEPAEGERGTANARAHDLYLLGLARLHFRTDADLRQALDYFQRAVQEDSTFALAYAGLAQTYAILPTLGSFSPQDALTRGTAAAARAVSLDPTLAEAHAAIGQMLQNFDWDLLGAEASYKRAIEFNSGDATAHQWYAETLMMLGRLDEAKREIDRAIELDPLSPAALNVRAYLLGVQGQTEAAFHAYDEELKLYPNFSLGWTNLALLAAAAHRYDLAAQAVPHTSVDTSVTNALGDLVAGMRDPTDRPAALRAAQRLSGRLPPGQAAAWDMALGERGPALDALERAYRDHSDPNLPYVMVHPLLAPLHGDARFDALADSLGVRPR